MRNRSVKWLNGSARIKPFELRIFAPYLLAIGCLVSAAFAQSPVVTYITKVALDVESDIYVDTLVTDERMHVVSKKIRIALAPRSTITESERYLIVSNARPRNESTSMLYRAYINGNAKNDWKKLPQQSFRILHFPFDCLLIDTSLQAGDKLTLEFRLASSQKIIQRCIFAREIITPEIQQYREKKGNDRVNDSILAKSLHQTGVMQKDFIKPANDRISIKAGNRLELLLKNHSLNRDSSVQYRLCNTGKITDTTWKNSGHLLTLANLPANDSFFLQLRYEGMSSVKQYKITVAPFWFQRSWATVVFVILAILFFIITPYFFRQRSLRNQKEKRQRNEAQLKNAQSQLNPHFIFNALNSIDALVHAGENEKATAYLADFSDMMRNTLRNGDIVFTNLSEDIAMLEKYIRIEQLRFDFKYVIIIDQKINTTEIEFPPMLLQPAVENAVKHGVAGMGNIGLIAIIISRSDHDLVITIKDNGHKKYPQKTKGTGHGIVFTKERINSLHKLYKHEIDYQLEYLPGETLVRFHFKNWL
jgi:anti-sigma regulatory factor (Ser/Thr protein kinase)/heme exporter protein D